MAVYLSLGFFLQMQSSCKCRYEASNVVALVCEVYLSSCSAGL